MPRSTKPRVLLVLSALCISACANVASLNPDTALAADLRLGDAVDTVCFSGRLTGFYSVTNDAIVVRRTQNEVYLLRIGFCPNAGRAEAISLPDNLRCLSRGDRIFVDDTPFPTQRDAADRTNSCLVNGIFEWNEDAVETETDSATQSDPSESE